MTWLTGRRICKYTAPMKMFFRKYAAIFAALLALCAQGCSKAPEAEHTLVMLTAPTVAPIVTPVPTPEPTPTPDPTPKPTKKPKDKDKDKDEDKEDKATPKPTEKPKGNSKTPNGNNYTPVELKKYDRKVKAFSSEAHNGSTITEGYFSDAKLTLVNIWSTT